ncbi:hypothetical protein PUN28_012650 [Cardiocondyla obscurior]|uniref:Uncharacterized protein n=1 Tax=Cardiocondyla obscurior TaxID=286306 RepID=A0AAW2FHX1_9HYME
MPARNISATDYFNFESTALVIYININIHVSLFLYVKILQIYVILYIYYIYLHYIYYIYKCMYMYARALTSISLSHCSSLKPAVAFHLRQGSDNSPLRRLASFVSIEGSNQTRIAPNCRVQYVYSERLFVQPRKKKTTFNESSPRSPNETVASTYGTPFNIAMELQAIRSKNAVSPSRNLIFLPPAMNSYIDNKRKKNHVDLPN